jgi:hypothetical protein
MIEKLALKFIDQIILAEKNYSLYYRKYDHLMIQNFILSEFVSESVNSKHNNDDLVKIVYAIWILNTIFSARNWRSLGTPVRGDQNFPRKGY